MMPVIATYGLHGRRTELLVHREGITLSSSTGHWARYDEDDLLVVVGTTGSHDRQRRRALE